MWEVVHAGSIGQQHLSRLGASGREFKRRRCFEKSSERSWSMERRRPFGGKDGNCAGGREKGALVAGTRFQGGFEDCAG